MNCQIWSLEKYARMVAEPVTTSNTCTNTVSTDGWQVSLPLSSVFTSIKGVSLGDSLMVVYKVQDRSHRFRVKFSSTPSESGEANCSACVNKLSQYFTIKLSDSTASGTNSQKVSCTPDNNKKVLSGDVTIGQLSEALITNSVKLPELYSKIEGSNIDLGTLVKLCLTDTSFPAFVGQVEKELEKVKAECS